MAKLTSPITPTPTWLMSWRLAAFGLLIVATVVAYAPAVRGQFLWDDDAHVTKPELRSANGLWRIWFEVGATQQYYPLVHSAFWVEHKLWGDSPVGYHVVNMALHVAAAALVMAVVRRLLLTRGVRWADSAAFLTAAVFALHPVQVETVAWITELKNTLSAVFYLGAMLTYLRFDATRRPGAYLLAALLFALGLLSKTVTATLPAALLVIFWWQRGRLRLREDVLPLLPWFALGLIAGVFTAWVEHDLIGAKGRAFELSAVERFMLSGRVVWFYLYKLLWPAELIFFYPRWSVDAANWRQWLYPAAWILLLIVAWRLARRERSLLAALLFFAGSLFPVLGFLNVYPFIYSFVADHFQYLPSLGIITLTCCGIVGLFSAPGWRIFRGALMLAIPLVLATLTYRQARAYGDVRTLYETALARNPSCWLAHNNLGIMCKNAGALDEAVDHYRRAIAVYAEDSQVYNNLGVALNALGKHAEAVAAYRQALRLRPANPEALGNLAVTWINTGRYAEAIDCLREALRYDPQNGGLHVNLGAAYQAAGRWQDAAAEYRKALELNANQPGVRAQLGLAEAAVQSPEQAIAACAQIVRAEPDNISARFQLAVSLAQAGRPAEAIEHYREVLRGAPEHFEAHNNLAALLARAGELSEAIPHFEQAVRLRPDRFEMLMNLAVAYTSAGRFAEALESAEQARKLAAASGHQDAVGKIDDWIASCRARTGAAPP